MARWLLIVLTLLLGSPVWAANTHEFSAGSNAAREQAAWFGDMVQPHVIGDCTPPVPAAALTFAAFACSGYVRATTGELVYVRQPAHTLGPLSAGNGTYWLALHRDTSTAVPDWTRQAGTHYLWRLSTTQPDTAAETLQVAQVTVAGAVITAVDSLGAASPVGRGVVYASQFTRTLGMTSAALNAAIQALPLHGGTVYIEAGTYTLTETLTLGNGGIGVASTRHGIVLEGLGTASWDKPRASVILQWATATEAPVIKVSGPLIGWGLKNLYIDGGGTASAGVFVVSGQYGDTSNIVVAGHKGNGIWSTCVPTFAGWNGVTDSLKNQWHNIWVWHLPPATAGTAGIALDSTANTCNTDFNTFYQPTIWIAGVDGWALYVGGADHNMFYNLHIGDDVTARSGIHFDYAHGGGFAGWPCANYFFGVGINNEGMSSNGTPLANNTCTNMIFGMTGGDPADYVPDLPGVAVVFGRRTNQNLVLIPGRSSASDQPVGHVELYTHPDFPRHMVPTIDSLYDLGIKTGPDGAKRFRDVHLGGHVVQNLRAVTGDTGLLLEDHYVQVSNTGGGTTFGLLSAATACGRSYVIKNLTSNVVVLTATGGDLIEGLATFNLDDNPSAVTIISDCTGWRILSSHGVH